VPAQSKTKKFKIPWPEIGDGIFTRHPNRKMDAQLTFAFDRDYIYAKGYMDASEILAKAVARKKIFGYPDQFVYPILFLFHHHLELRLKHIIRIYYDYENINEAVPAHHDIVQLWNIGKKFILDLNKGHDRTPVTTVEGIIKDLESLNRSSEGYRYAFNKKGGRTILVDKTVNIQHLSKLIPKINSFFDAVCMQIDHVKEYIDYSRDQY
jgi:hypothetical protein